MDLNEASKGLAESLINLRQAAEDYVKQYGTDLNGLIKLVQHNQSAWSGGPNSVNNITEAVIRDKAMDELARLIYRLPR